MALNDYRLCDVCGDKTFYDAQLRYEDSVTDDDAYRIAGKNRTTWERLVLDHLGDWAVLCNECSKTHRTQIVPIEATPQAEPKRPRVETSLQRHQKFWSVDLVIGVQRFRLSVEPETLEEAEWFAETLRKALGITGDSDVE